ncbi:MAG: ATP-binding cassette domain-containing protein [Eggerthellaceae bacterium]|nr:ATP-binding cassette domain-containing protein [Eggerthellaceae bacterium]
MIEIKNLHKSFGDVEVLKGIDITIRDGCVYGLVGVSGAGKSTLLRCINGLEGFDSGTLLVDDVDVAGLSETSLNEFRKNIGMIFQHFSLLERKTVLQNVTFPLKCHGVDKDESRRRAMEMLELVGLSEKVDALPRELSGGQKQRVAIARALAMNPSMLLCDEATSALDPNITRSILGLLGKINRELGITIVMVTHAMSVVKEVCDEVAILDHGTLVYKGGVEDLFLRHQEVLAPVTGSDGRRETESGEKAYLLVQRENEQDVLARVALGTSVPFRVVWGGLDSYKGRVAGNYLISVKADEAPAIERFLASSDIEWSANVERTAEEAEALAEALEAK